MTTVGGPAPGAIPAAAPVQPVAEVGPQAARPEGRPPSPQGPAQAPQGPRVTARLPADLYLLLLRAGPLTATVEGRSGAGETVLRLADGRTAALPLGDAFARGATLLLRANADMARLEALVTLAPADPRAAAKPGETAAPQPAKPASAVPTAPPPPATAELVALPPAQPGRAAPQFATDLWPGDRIMLRLPDAAGGRPVPALVLGGAPLQPVQIAGPFGRAALDASQPLQPGRSLPLLPASPLAGPVGALGTLAALGSAWPRLEALFGATPGAPAGFVPGAPLQAQLAPAGGAPLSIEQAAQLIQAAHTAAHPTALAALVHAALPALQNGPAGLAEALFFMSAARRSDPAQWLGDDLMRIAADAEGGQPLARMLDDFVRIGRLPDADGPWQSWLVPFWENDAVRQLRIHLHRRGDGPDQAGGQRFLVETELSRLGALQLDGFFRERHLRIVLRSQRPLPRAGQRGIEDAFRDRLLSDDLTGEIAFDGTGRFVSVDYAPEPMEGLFA